MIELKRLNKTYFSKSGQNVVALNDINIKLDETGLVLINGESGCGKTTLLNILGGLDKKTSGEYIIDGKNIEGFKSLDDFRNQIVGFVFQDFNLIDNLNVFDNINLALSLQDKVNQKIVSEVLNKVGLQGYENRKINELSGGQKQRVAIARALVKNSQIILADEPTGNLDSETSKEIFDILKRISKEKLVVVVSHDKFLSNKYADRLIELNDGNIISDTKYISDTKINKTNYFNTTSKPLKFRYIANLAKNNIWSHKFKTIIAIILLSLTTLTLCIGSSLLFFDAQKAVSISIKNNSMFIAQSIYTSDENNYKPVVFDSYTDINMAVYSEVLDDDKHIKGYNITLDLNNSKYFEDCFYLIESKQNLLELGYDFYGANDLSNDGVYITDYVIDYLLANEYLLSEPIDNANYQAMVGKYIQKYNEFENTFENKYKIDGIIKTDYRNYYDENFDIKLEYNKEFSNFDVYEKFVCQNKNTMYLPIYFNETYLKNNYKEVSILDLQSSSQKSLNIQTNQDNFINRISLSSNIYNFDTIYNGKIVPASSIELTENEILINLKLYNNLYNNEVKFLELLKHVTNLDGEKLCDYNFKNINTDLKLIYKHDKLNQSLLNINAKKIVGIVIKDFSSQETDGFEIYTKESDIKNNFILNYCNNLTKVKTDSNILKKVYTLRESFNIGVFNIIAEDIYSLEQSAKIISFIFLSLSVVLGLISIFVAINVVSLSINEKKREIGILRAIGTKSKDVEKIFLLENAIVGFLSFIISQAFICLSIVFMNVIFSKNSCVGTKYLFYDYKTLLISLITTIILCVIVCIIPIKKINKLNPIDSIRSI